MPSLRPMASPRCAAHRKRVPTVVASDAQGSIGTKGGVASLGKVTAIPIAVEAHGSDAVIASPSQTRRHSESRSWRDPWDQRRE